MGLFERHDNTPRAKRRKDARRRKSAPAKVNLHIDLVEEDDDKEGLPLLLPPPLPIALPLPPLTASTTPSTVKPEGAEASITPSERPRKNAFRRMLARRLHRKADAKVSTQPAYPNTSADALDAANKKPTNKGVFRRLSRKSFSIRRTSKTALISTDDLDLRDLGSTDHSRPPSFVITGDTVAGSFDPTPPPPALPHDDVASHDDDCSSVSSDNSSAYSEASLLSDLDTATSMGTEIVGLNRMKRRYELRDAQLGKIADTRGPKFAAYFEYNEQAAREVELEAYVKRTVDSEGISEEECRKGIEEALGPRDDKSISWLKRVHLLLHFEAFHTIPGVLSVVCYILACSSVYSIIDHGCRNLSKEISNYFGTNTFYAGVLCISLWLLRITGVLWYWTEGHSYDSVKFEIHNRLRLGYWDARLMSWLLKKHVRYMYAISLGAFYGAYVAICYFQDLGMAFLWSSLDSFYDALLKDTSSFLGEIVDPEDACEEIEEMVSLATTRRWIGLYLCDSDWGELAFAVDILVFFAAIKLFKWLGKDFMLWMI